MDSAQRKAAAAAYKERKPNAGVFRIVCAGTGQVWVGAAPGLDGIENRTRFMLRMGNHRSASLQSAWAACGDAGLSFATLETLDPGLSDYARRGRLKERLSHWSVELGAEAL